MTNTQQQQQHHRGTWKNKADFILALISYGVGLGNVWRFVQILFNKTKQINWMNLFEDFPIWHILPEEVKFIELINWILSYGLILCSIIIGAFLIPFLISSVAVGIPYALLEVSLGQWMKEGGIGAWNLTPIFKGKWKFLSNTKSVNLTLLFSNRNRIC